MRRRKGFRGAALRGLRSGTAAMSIMRARRRTSLPARVARAKPIGRSRGGQTTKKHVLTSAQHLPVCNRAAAITCWIN